MQLPEEVWRLTHVSQSLLQLLETTESHYSCQLLFLLSAPIVLIHRTAAADAAAAAALRRRHTHNTTGVTSIYSSI